MLLVGLLLVAAGVVVTALAWPRMTPKVSALLVGLGGVALLAVLGGLLLGLPSAGTVLALIFVLVAVFAFARPSGPPNDSAHPAVNAKGMAIGALLGALPGLVIVGSAWLLLSVGAITADQSQAAFIGVPLTAAGAVIGAAVAVIRQRSGANRRGHAAAGRAPAEGDK